MEEKSQYEQRFRVQEQIKVTNESGTALFMNMPLGKYVVEV